MKLHVNGGRMEPVQRDTIIRISGLEAYTHYYIEADKNSFENLAWIIRKPVIKVEVDPNLFRLVEIPVAVVGEISGTVYLDNSASKDGIARIIVNIHDEKGTFVAKVLTEEGGFFTYLGLAPGSYTAQIDPSQMKKLGMEASPTTNIIILPLAEGDIVSGIDFTLRMK